MTHVARLLCFFLFLSNVFAERNIQSLIDSGEIYDCFLRDGTLQLSHMGLQSLDGIEHIPTASSIRELQLAYNQIQTLDLQQFCHMPMLYVLNLGFNEINSIKAASSGVLQNLEMLFVNNNIISRLPANIFAACPNLQALYLQNNVINTLENNCLHGLPNLKLLYLYDNCLTTLPSNVFASLPSLHVLYLRNNLIQSLEQGWSNGLDQLGILDLSDNKIGTVGVKNRTEVDHFLSSVKKEVYQDILVDGVTIKEGVKDCEVRYPNIKKIADTYKRPFTVLDIGASEGYFSLRLAAEYDCTCVMIEGDATLLLPQICRLNKKRTNLIVLEKFITSHDLKELGACEHFDLVLAFNVIHQMGADWKETIDSLLALGDHILIETPPPGCHTASHKELLPLIEAYLSQNGHGKIVGTVPRYGRPGLPTKDQKYSNVYQFDMHKNVLLKPTWGSPNIRFYAVDSNFQDKTLYKPRINKTITWKKGINLWTFKNLNGVYPSKDVVHQEIKRLSAFAHRDFLPWNMIIQGNNVELIDWEDNNAPEFMHDYEACIASFESKTLERGMK